MGRYHGEFRDGGVDGMAQRRICIIQFPPREGGSNLIARVVSSFEKKLGSKLGLRDNLS